MAESHKSHRSLPLLSFQGETRFMIIKISRDSINFLAVGTDTPISFAHSDGVVSGFLAINFKQINAFSPVMRKLIICSMSR